MNDDLDVLRARLTALDGELIDRIAERQRIVAEIGRSKRNSGTATRDFLREKDVIGFARQRAAEQGVDPDVAEALMTTLIRTSLTSQERARVVAEGTGSGRDVLVIGGAGKMGRWFADFFNSQGFKITIADPIKPPVAYAYFADWREAGLAYDVIVVATELGLSASIIGELAVARPAGLVFDIGSLKSPLKNSLAAAAAADLSIASIHPMFGPDTRLLSGRHLIFVDVGSARATAQAKSLFSATMVEQLDMTLEDHDRLIAYVLGLSHALNIAFFTALAESGEAAPKLAKLSSTTFDAQLAVAEQVASESPRLYFEIQHLNEYGMHPLEALCRASERLLDAVQSGDEEKFEKMMLGGRDYFAKHGSSS